MLSPNDLALSPETKHHIYCPTSSKNRGRTPQKARGVEMGKFLPSAAMSECRGSHGQSTLRALWGMAAHRTAVSCVRCSLPARNVSGIKQSSTLLLLSSPLLYSALCPLLPPSRGGGCGPLDNLQVPVGGRRRANQLAPVHIAEALRACIDQRTMP